MRGPIAAAALAAAASAAAAQPIYKHTTPEGRIVYTDVPTAGWHAAPAPADEGFAAAQTGYLAAKRRRVAGVTPLAAERTGRYLRPAYWQRQRELAQDLALARERLAHVQTLAQR
jgi:hypothetical protein